MKRLIILGAGGLGREVLEWAQNINEINKKWDSFGFLDYNDNALDEKKCNARIIGDDDTYKIRMEDEFVCAIGNSKIRQTTVEKMIHRGAKFVSIIHPTAVIAQSAEIRDPVIICPYCTITSNAFIGPGSIINMNCTIAHDVRIGEYCTISPNCNITGQCIIGDRVCMGVGVHIIPSISIGDDAFLCAGSVIMTKVRKGQRYIGNPASRFVF